MEVRGPVKRLVGELEMFGDILNSKLAQDQWI